MSERDATSGDGREKSPPAPAKRNGTGEKNGGGAGEKDRKSPRKRRKVNHGKFGLNTVNPFPGLQLAVVRALSHGTGPYEVNPFALSQGHSFRQRSPSDPIWTAAMSSAGGFARWTPPTVACCMTKS